MDKQKLTNEKREELLTKFKINSLEIDMIKNGTPLNLLINNDKDEKGGKSKKVDIAELQRIASLTMPKSETVKEETINNSHNEFEEMKNQL